MPEESRSKKSKSLGPLTTALLGVLTGVSCLGFVAIAHHIGLPLSDVAKEGLTLGGMAALLGGVVGARFMPTKAEEKP
jgi:hypothetical protein